MRGIYCYDSYLKQNLLIRIICLETFFQLSNVTFKPLSVELNRLYQELFSEVWSTVVGEVYGHPLIYKQ